MRLCLHMLRGFKKREEEEEDEEREREREERWVGWKDKQLYSFA